MSIVFLIEQITWLVEIHISLLTGQYMLSVATTALHK